VREPPRHANSPIHRFNVKFSEISDAGKRHHCQDARNERLTCFGFLSNDETAKIVQT
jgi:hypothetical protein